MSEDSQKPTRPLPSSGWQHNPQDASSVDDSSNPDAFIADHEDAPQNEPEVRWTASEFIAHHKDARWYASVIAITLVLATIVRVLTHDNISTAMVVVVGIFFCIAAARKPRMLTYVVNMDGITIGERFYPYSDFRSFTVITDGAFSSIELVPMKRFMPLTSVYCSPDNEDDAVDMLAAFLPYEDRGHSIVDGLARRIRF
jgi:hypothetical protein